MSTIANDKDISCRINLPDGDQIVLMERLGMRGLFSKIERARNVFRVNAKGRVKWRIRSKFDADGGPFTNLQLENGLTAYRWDGATYSVDLDTGNAVPLALER